LSAPPQSPTVATQTLVRITSSRARQRSVFADSDRDSEVKPGLSNRPLSGWKHLWAILALPFTVTVVIPTFILHFLPIDSLALGQWSESAVMFFSAVAALFLIVGLVLVVTTIELFAGVGGGTLAPWDPPRYLVVEGPYQYVRNPMISGVLLILLGQTLALASLPLLVYFIVFWAVQDFYYKRSEEAGLLKRFGPSYAEYMKHVPRWVPRTTPWRG